MKTLLAILPLTLAALTASSNVTAQSASMQRLDGVWIFRALFPGQADLVYTGTARFVPDGTFSGPPNNQRSGPSVGEWIRVGNREFAFTFVANTYDDAGNFQSTSRVRGMMTLGEGGLTAEGRTQVDILNSAGQIILTRSATFTGERLTVEPF